MTPIVPIIEYTCELRYMEENEPLKIRNSPMKPFNPGKPIDERHITRNRDAYTGMIFDSPPYADISRV
jgi:hypothetical protein